MKPLDELIDHAKMLRRFHHNAGRQIEAAAAAIREKALIDAKAALIGYIDQDQAFRPIL